MRYRYLRNPLLAVALTFSVSVTFAAQPTARAEYIGGTCANIPLFHSGDIAATDDVYFVYVSKHTKVKIPYERINLLEYGQDVSRRLIATLISPVFAAAKKREHFLTIGFEDDNGHQQAMLFKLNKEDVRAALIALEARTGQRVQYQDDEARIAGKG